MPFNKAVLPPATKSWQADAVGLVLGLVFVFSDENFDEVFSDGCVIQQ